MTSPVPGMLLLCSILMWGCMGHRGDEENRSYTAQIDIVVQGQSLQQPLPRILILCPETSDTIAYWTCPRPGTETTSAFFETSGRRQYELVMIRGSIREGVPETLTTAPFTTHPWSTNFVARADSISLHIESTDHLFPVRQGNPGSRWVFLLLFMSIKIVCSLLIYSTGSFPWKVFPSFIGAFLFSVLLTWHVPIRPIELFVLSSWSEGALIFISNRKHISILKTSVVVTGSNIAAFGLVHLLYTLYVLW